MENGKILSLQVSLQLHHNKLHQSIDKWILNVIPEEIYNSMNVVKIIKGKLHFNVSTQTVDSGFRLEKRQDSEFNFH